MIRRDTRSHQRMWWARECLAVLLLTLLAVPVLVAQTAVVIAQTDDSSFLPSPPPLMSVVRDDLFELSITTPRSTWTVGEPIEVSTTLVYVGTAPETVVGGSPGLVGFGIEQLDGPIDQSPVWIWACRSFPFATGDVQSFPFEKSGGYSASDPMASFWRGWFDDPLLRPPVGTYRLFAEARYGPPECGRVSTVTASLTVEVVEVASAPVVGLGESYLDEPIIGVPRGDIEDAREVPWSRIEIHPDGRSLDVYYLNGLEECFGLDRIEVSPTDSGLDIKVFTGHRPFEGLCRLPGRLWMTTVELDELLVTGGQGDA